MNKGRVVGDDITLWQADHKGLIGHHEGFDLYSEMRTH